MDTIEKYHQAILDFLSAYAKEMYANDPSGIATQVIADKMTRHYLLLRFGWNKERHVHYTPFHFNIEDNKVWIQLNNTEAQVADELMKRGIPKSAIVLAFHPKELRVYTGFAIA